MARYRDLGPTLPLTAAADTTGNNTGNWTIVADQKALNFRIAQAEVYQISIDGPVGSSFTLYRNSRLWNKVLQGWQNYYDPQQPLIVRAGDTLFFYWNVADTTTPTPTATIWLRYDLDLPENKDLD
jgi:hypothetical protein